MKSNIANHLSGEPVLDDRTVLLGNHGEYLDLSEIARIPGQVFQQLGWSVEQQLFLSLMLRSQAHEK